MASPDSRGGKANKPNVIPPRVANDIRILFGASANLAIVHDRGLSEAKVYRIESLSSRYAMKRWPASTHRERLSEIHAFQEHLAGCDVPLVPGIVKWSNGDTLLEAEGVWWEISEWKPGAPLDRLGEINEDQLLQCAEALAMFHRRSESREAATLCAPGLQQRADGMRSAMRMEGEPRRRFLASISMRNGASDARLLEDLHARAMDVIPGTVELLQSLSQARNRCFWILRDVWREHILFQDNRLSGVIDFGAARIDWPGLDLVRAFGTLMLESDPRWPAAVDRYLKRRPDASITLARLQAVHRASVALSALQWIDWFAEGRFDWTQGASRGWHRAMELRQQLEDFGASPVR